MAEVSITSHIDDLNNIADMSPEGWKWWISGYDGDGNDVRLVAAHAASTLLKLPATKLDAKIKDLEKAIMHSSDLRAILQWGEKKP